MYDMTLERPALIEEREICVYVSYRIRRSQISSIYNNILLYMIIDTYASSSVSMCHIVYEDLRCRLYITHDTYTSIYYI